MSKVQVSAHSSGHMDDAVEIRVKVVNKETITITFTKSGKKITYGVFPLYFGKKPPEEWGMTAQPRNSGVYSIAQDGVLIYPTRREAVERALIAGVKFVA